MAKEYQHITVLKNEVVELLRPQSNQNFIDGTLGGGGHSQAILRATGPDGKLLAFELDQRAIKAAQENLKEYSNRLIIENSSYVHLKKIVEKNNFNKVSGIVLDLGLSSDQLDKADRGFSFKDHGSLDMRFDPENQKLTASDIVLDWPENKLVEIFQEYGEVKQAKRLARGLVSWRKELPPQAVQAKQKQKFVKTSMLVSTILRILNIKESSLPRFRTHPATTVFQALRIAVNSELSNLQLVLPQAIDILSSGGRLAIISFHSLEDRIVKHYFKNLAKGCVCPPDIPVCNCNNKPSIRIITKKGVKASVEEIKNNPRSRSAILRVVEKI